MLHTFQNQSNTTWRKRLWILHEKRIVRYSIMPFNHPPPPCVGIDVFTALELSAEIREYKMRQFTRKTLQVMDYFQMTNNPCTVLF